MKYKINQSNLWIAGKTFNSKTELLEFLKRFNKHELMHTYISVYYNNGKYKGAF